MTGFQRIFDMMKKCGLEHVEHENPYFFIYYKKYTYLIFYKKSI